MIGLKVTDRYLDQKYISKPQGSIAYRERARGESELTQRPAVAAAAKVASMQLRWMKNYRIFKQVAEQANGGREADEHLTNRNA